MIDPETIRKLLSYDPDTGLLTWTRRPLGMFTEGRNCNQWNTRYAGKPAFGCFQDDYLHGAIFSIKYRAHRIAWAIHHGEWPSGQIDHINGIKHDNRITNLRDVTNQENSRNSKKPKNNTSGCVGVCWNKSSSKWLARIANGMNAVHLGSFEDINEAIAARKAAEKKIGFHKNHGREL